MVKKVTKAREGAQVPTCEMCDARPWTDWRPTFQQYLCTKCNEKAASRAVRFERHGRRNHPVTVGVSMIVDEE
jgi:hypothetical protein